MTPNQFEQFHNNPESEYSPEQAERIKFLVKSFENGLNGPGIIGYHGTSLETLQYLIRNGSIPGSTFNLNLDAKQGTPELSFYPKGAAVEISARNPKFGGDDALQAAASYAGALAESHAFLTRLGLDINNRRYYNLIHNDEIQEQLVKERIVTPRQIAAAKEFAEGRRGFVIGLSKQVYNTYSYRPAPTDTGDKGEMIIECPGGINYRFAIGLEPQGQNEWNFIENLQQKYSH